MKTIESRYSKFIKICLKVVRVLPRYSNKYSKKTYTQHQLGVIALFMKYLRRHYRDVIELLMEMPYICYLIGLEQMPHFTTIQKFVKRNSYVLFYSLLNNSVHLFKIKRSNLGIDASGFSKTNASYYYTLKINGEIPYKIYLKHSISVDLSKQAILSSISRNSPYHDNRDFKPLILKSNKLVVISIGTADKAFDSENNHKLLRKIGSDVQIPIKKGVKRGYYRNKMNFDENVYHQRSKVETVFSVIKRLFGYTLNSRKFLMQKKEVLLMDVTYNIHRYVKYSLFYIEDFYKAMIS